MSGRRRRAAVCAAAISVATALGWGPGAKHVLAGSGTTGLVTNINLDGTGCSVKGNSVNPFTTESNGFVTTSNTRPWDDIKDFTVNEVTGYNPAGNGKPAGAAVTNALAVTIDLCASIPTSFPPANRDSGVEYILSFDDPSSYPCAGAPTGGPAPQQIGTGLRGEPVYDGPFPSCAFYRYFGFLNVTAPNTIDFGVGWFDQIGVYTFLDTEQTIHTATGGNADPTNIGIFTAANGLPRSVVKFVIPQNWWWQASPPLWQNEQIFGGGDTLADVTATTFALANLDLPQFVCPSVSVIGCPPGIGLLAQVDDAPGQQACPNLAGTGPGDTSVPSNPNPGMPCPSTTPYSYDYGTLGLGYPVGAIQSPVGGPTPTSYTAVAGTSFYDACAGDSWPSGIPGQGPGQSAGPLYGTPNCSTADRAPAAQAYHYESVWGRIPIPGNGAGHFVPNGVSITVSGPSATAAPYDGDHATCVSGSGGFTFTPAIDLNNGSRTLSINFGVQCSGLGDDSGFYTFSMTGTEAGNCASGAVPMTFTGNGPEGAFSGSIRFEHDANHFLTTSTPGGTFFDGKESHWLQLWLNTGVPLCPGPTSSGSLTLADGVVWDAP